MLVISQMLAVDSEAIDSVGFGPCQGAGYGETTVKKLYIRFHTGRVWAYNDVPFDTADALYRADSVGGYYNRYIKGGYPGEDVTTEFNEALSAKAAGAGEPAQPVMGCTICFYLDGRTRTYKGIDRTGGRVEVPHEYLCAALYDLQITGVCLDAAWRYVINPNNWVTTITSVFKDAADLELTPAR